ncbi:MAG TPA: hypothetical protein VGO59_11525 [Verrucomicrobiae bacterium]
MALVNEQSAAAGIAPGGFINPAIYSLGKNTNVPLVFHDIADFSGNQSLYSNYFAVPGYDLCTGWGTPDGSNFINALSPPPEGSLAVTISPPVVAAAGAQWRVDGGLSRKSGATAASLSAGNDNDLHAVSFTAIPGWVAPPGQTVSIKRNTTARAAGVYVKYIPRAPLTVSTNGRGAILPVENGKLLAIGANYRLTATPALNFLFSNWVGGTSEPYQVLSTNPLCAFTMQSNLVLTANFVTNQFLAAQGGYYGLFSDANSPRQHASSGGFHFNLLSARSFAGALSCGSNTVPFFGAFDVGGQARVVTRLNPTISVTATLQLDFAGQTVGGTVSNANFAATLNGFRNAFSAAHPAAAYAGQYTLVILGTNDPAHGPFGFSYGALTVSPLGIVTIGGALADGTLGVTESSAISPNGCWPFYVKLSGGAGSLWAWTCISNHQITASASWINATNSSALAVYRGGFANQNATIIGSSYVRTNKPLFGFTNGQAVVEQGGAAPFAFTNRAAVSAADVIALTGSNKLLLRINPANGVLSGSFANPLNVKQIIPINGVLLQGDSTAAGYFLGTNQSGFFTLAPP